MYAIISKIINRQSKPTAPESCEECAWPGWDAWISTSTATSAENSTILNNESPTQQSKRS